MTNIASFPAWPNNVIPGLTGNLKTMKRILSFILLAALLLPASCSKPQYQVSGQFKDTPSDLCLMFLTKDYARCDGCDTLHLDKNGRFGFDVDQEKYAQIMITTFKEGDEGELVPSYEPYILLGTVPGEHVVITGSLAEPVYDGSRYYKLLAEYEKQSKADMDEYTAIVEKYRTQMQANPDDVESISAQMQEEVSSIMNRMDANRIRFIENHPDEEFAGYLVAGIGDQDKLAKAEGILSERVRTGVMAPYIANTRKILAQQAAYQSNRGHVEVGQEAPDFTLPKPDGTPFSLSSLRGKYVLLDFWGTWCKWCIKGIPTLKEIYGKYSDKLEIVSISCSDSDEAWHKGLEKYEMPWTQVHNQDQEGDDGPVVDSIYGVEGYPSFYLIDPKGKIERIFVGESDEFVAYMDKTFK